jgi:hypothetical protein
VIGFTILFAHTTDKFTPLAVRRIGTFLAAAASAESRRIQNVESGGSSSL